MSAPKTAEHTPTRPPMQVSFDCDAGEPLPIKIPVGSTVHFLPLARVVLPTREIQFYDQFNFGNSAKLWPDPEAVKLANQKGEQGTSTYRCEVQNHGQENVLDLVIPVAVYYGSTSPLARKAANNIVLNPLDRGKTFTFFVINDCPQDMVMQIPHIARGKYPEEKSAHRFRLEVENIYANSTISFPPDSGVDWTYEACK